MTTDPSAGTLVQGDTKPAPDAVLVEAVARALAVYDGVEDPDELVPENTKGGGLPWWTMYAGDARAAIAAYQARLADRIDRIALERADWLVDAVACATQDRRFLRGDEQCDEVICDAVLMNGEKAIAVALRRLIGAAS